MRMADRHLVDKCLNGDSAAFGMLVDRYKESVYALAYSRLRNFHDAEDITQEAFTKAYQKLRTLRQWDEFYAWIYAITSNLCKNWIKASARRPDREFIEDHPATLLTRYSMESRNEDPMLEVLNAALDSLPESYQQVLTLHYLGGMDGVEIAEFLGKSPSAIWQRLSRARESLRKEILDMMSETFQQHRIKAGFTFKIVEMIERVRIQPLSPKVLPWGLSLATGLIIAVLGLGSHLNITHDIDYASSLTSSAGVIKALKIGELPVQLINVSDITAISSQQLRGDGLGNVTPDLQNALFMSPQVGDTWTKKADMPIGRFQLSASAVNGRIYVIGGCNTKGDYPSGVEEYDPVRNKWTEKNDMPTTREGLSTCVVNGKIYALGGYGQGQPIEFSTVEEYDPVKDKWTKKANMPTERAYFSARAVNGKIYAIGGWRSADAISKVEEYDPIADKWTERPDMPATRYGFSAEAVNGKIYVIGGCPLGWLNEDLAFGNGGVLSTVEEYDPMSGKWTKRADMPTARMFLTTSVVNGRIYAIGGTDDKWNILSTIEEYDPMKDIWTKKTDMPTARCWTSSSAVSGKIYVIGGTSSGILSTVEEYDTGFGGESINFRGKLPTTWGEVRTALNKSHLQVRKPR